MSFSRDEWRRLSGIYGVVALLHAVGWGLYLHFASHYPALVGLGLVAYLFGLRHAFDADHIAAIDDTARYLLQKGTKPLGIGFFFSLGHSSVVLGLSVAIGCAARLVKPNLPQLQSVGGVIGTGVSGIFLLTIGVLNFGLLLDILKIWGQAKTGAHNHRHLEDLIQRRGWINRWSGGRFRQRVSHSWQMVPLGLLFGLGFDTASEVGFLSMSAGASAGNFPLGAVLSLPIIFAAGMSIMDTTDGVLMAKAYDWALHNPLRKIFYNAATTGLSVAAALIIGTVELLQVGIDRFSLHGPGWNFIASLHFGILGYWIVGLFLVAWGMSVAVWKFRRFETRFQFVSDRASQSIRTGIS